MTLAETPGFAARHGAVPRTTWHDGPPMRRPAALLACVALLTIAAFVWPASGSTPASPSITTPNDPLFLNLAQCQGVQNCVNQQWNLMSDGRGTSVDRAWDLTKGEGVTIAVLDSG